MYPNKTLSPQRLNSNYPPNSAPNYLPDISAGIHSSELHTLRNFTHSMNYIWLKSNGGFWMYPINFLNNYMNGYIWNDPSWVYSSVNLDSVESYF